MRPATAYFSAGRVILSRLLILFFLSFPSSAFFREFTIQNISAGSGISNKIVIAIIQDTEGYMWLGTESGLNRYDGYDFRVYMNDPEDPRSLPGNRISCLETDHGGNLWVGTGSGFCRYDRETDDFTVYHLPSASPARRADKILTIMADRDGRLWLGTWGEGLFLFDPRNEECKRLAPDGSSSVGLPDRVIKVFRDSRGRFWAGTEEGLFEMRFNGEFVKIQFDPGIPPTSNRMVILSISEDGKGNIRVGTQEGLFLLDTRDLILKDTGPAWPERIMKTRVYTILEDKYERLWIGTWDGIYCVDPDGRLHSLHTDTGNPGLTLSSRLVLSMYIDRAGMIWTGSMTGLDLFNGNRSGFRNYDMRDILEWKENSHYFTSVYEDGDGILWFGTLKKGMIRFDRRTGSVKNFCRLDGEKSLLSCDTVIMIGGDGGDRIHIGTTNGLNIFRKRAGRFSAFRHQSDDPQSISNDRVMGVLFLDPDNLLVGTMNGLNALDMRTGKCQRYFPETGNPVSLSSEQITSLIRDRKGRIWVGTYGGGLNRFFPEKGEFRRVQEPSESARGVFFLYPAIESADGMLWMGSYEGGLKMFDPDTREFRNFYTRDGLPSDIVFDVAEDIGGNIWFSTNEGLSKLDRKTWAVTSFSRVDGVLIDLFSINSSYKSGSGELFFAGNNGFVSFFPESVKKTSFIPKTVITSIKKITRKGMTDVPFRGKEVPEFNSGDRMITFEFSSLSFLNPQKNRYRYRLQGMSDQWVDLGTRNSVSFGGLSPGDYILNVSGSNCFGDWNNAGTSLKFRVLPAFWQTWWFRLMIVLLIISAFIVFHLSRLRTQEKRLKNESEMEKLFKRKGISVREREIILLVLDGKTSREIEDLLFISYGTVKNHIYNVYKKLNIKNRAELINLFKDISSS